MSPLHQEANTHRFDEKIENIQSQLKNQTRDNRMNECVSGMDENVFVCILCIKG